MKNGLLVTSVKVGAAALLLAGALGLGGGKASADVPKGAVYTLTNTASGNAVAVFDRAGNGTLTAAGSYATGGNGTGAALGSQNSVIMNNNEKWLFAVDAGSNDIAVFSVDPVGLTLIGRTPSGGTDPISLTVHKDVLYVLNAGGAGNITGFNVMGDGTLVAIPNSTEPLSSGAALVRLKYSSAPPAGYSSSRRRARASSTPMLSTRRASPARLKASRPAAIRLSVSLSTAMTP